MQVEMWFLRQMVRIPRTKLEHYMQPYERDKTSFFSYTMITDAPKKNKRCGDWKDQ